jgi:hypothetical protein
MPIAMFEVELASERVREWDIEVECRLDVVVPAAVARRRGDI